MMADRDSKRFYWLKLKKDFFHQHQLKVLKALPNGRTYALIYLELLAESTSHNGALRYSELMPYDVVTLSAVIDEDKDTLQVAIDTLRKLELVDVLDDQTIYMNAIEGMIGSETGDAQRKREYRERIKMDNVPKLSVNCPLEYRDKSIENRNIKKEIYKEKKDTKFVPPTLEQIKEEILKKGYNIDAEAFFNYYQTVGWVVGKGKKMKNWSSALSYWNRNNKQSVKTDSQELNREINPTYDTSNNVSLSEEELKELQEMMKGRS